VENRLALRCLLAVVVMAVALGLSACGSSDSGSDTGTTGTTQSAESGSAEDASASSDQLASKLPARFQEAGTIKVATAEGNPPYESVDPDSGELVGFDMDIIRLLASKLGLEAEIQALPFAGVVPGLQSGRYDAAITSLTITQEREEVINLLAYLQIGTGLLVTKGNPNGVTDLNSTCGMKMGVAKGSANELPVKEASAECSGGSIEIVGTEGNDLLALQSGRVEVSAMDAAAAAATAKAQPNEFEVPNEEIYGAALAGIGFPKDEVELAEAFQAALELTIENGEYTELIEKWNIPNLAYEEATLNPETEL